MAREEIEYSVIWEGNKITYHVHRYIHTYMHTNTHMHTDPLRNAFWILLEEKWLERTQGAFRNGI